MDIKFEVNEAENTYYSFSEHNESYVHYEVKGVGVSLIGKPDILSDTVEVTIAPYTKQEYQYSSDLRLFLGLNQLIKIIVPSNSNGDLQAVSNELFNFCTTRLGKYFSNDETAFDYNALAEDLSSESAFVVKQCAALDPVVRHKIYKKAVALDVPFLTDEQREFARQPLAYHERNGSSRNRTKNRSNGAFVSAGEIQSINATLGLNHDLTKDLIITKVESDDQSSKFSICQPMPERRLREDSALSPDDLDVVINVEFFSANGGRTAAISTATSKRFAFINLPKVEDEKRQEAEVINHIAESVGASLCSSFFKRAPHVRESGDKYVAGFDGEIQSRFENVHISHKATMSIADQPAVHILMALDKLGYLQLQMSKSDSKSQKVYNVTGQGGTATVTTVEMDAVSRNSWGGVSPTRWLSPNNSLGKATNSSALIERLVSHGIVDLAKFGGNQVTATTKLKLEVNNFLNDKNNELGNVAHAMNDGRGSLIKAEPPVPTPTNNPALMSKFEDYLRGRGISQSVIDKAKEQNVIYTCKDALLQDAVGMVAHYNHGDGNKIAVQRFILNSATNKWTKQMVKGAATSGSAHIIKGEDERFIVLGEANIDMYSFLSAIELAGGNSSFYSAHSLMSAGYVDAWLEHSFGLRLPKGEQAENGFLINEETESLPLEQATDALQRFFDQYDNGVRFIDDGRKDTQQQLAMFRKVVELAQLPPEKVSIQQSANRETGKVLANSGVVVFDRTCFEITMNNAGICLDKNGELTYSRKVSKYVPIETPEHFAEAEKRVKDKIGKSSFVLAFDNDHAGHPKSVALDKFFKSINVGVTPIAIPFESKRDSTISHESVVAEVVSGKPVVDMAVNEFMVMNDMNDFLLKMRSSEANRDRLSNVLANIIRGNVDVSGMMSNTSRVAAALYEQRHQIQHVLYKHVFDITKEIEIHKKDYYRAKSNRASLAKWESKQSQLIAKIRNGVKGADIPNNHRTFLESKLREFLVEPEKPVSGFKRAVSDEAFATTRKLGEDLVALNRNYSKVKSVPEEKANWSKQFNALIKEFDEAFGNLNDREQTNIQKNPTVQKAIELVKKSNERNFAPRPPQQSGNQSRPRPSR
ncbi:hypothetical protein OTK49_00530 [Vibrio coralliirubri]|uniref:hypothetical protein n=1 Tax=Vibrio coralliirubri TaxID=1516159 RepID=UPI002283C050|nr:hypothetical protein [Vibrio coralliirubri]MCY9861027.1 hypothetical protein [Vibrio coralliirubri]